MDNLGFGLWLTALGMGTVFLLLVLLMVALRVIAWTDRRGRRARDAAASGTPAGPAARGAAGDAAPAEPPSGLTDDEVAAIAIAVVTHARVRRLQAAPAMREHEPGSHLFANRWVGIGRGYQQQPWRRGA
ncbi:MAG: OadG family protein [Propionibacteriaceae bacterium]|jgi:sodium pump decarboxylase gamma subunit|nr:OadG family protein [Propionibacteriaceae bacterium]